MPTDRQPIIDEPEDPFPGFTRAMWILAVILIVLAICGWLDPVVQW